MNDLQTLEGYPISPQQKLLWTAGRSSHHALVSVPENRSLNQLMSTISKLVDTYEILRTRLEKIPGMEFPLQVIDELVRPNSVQDYTNQKFETEPELYNAFKEKNQTAVDQCTFGCYQLTDGSLYLWIEMPSFMGDAHTFKSIIASLVDIQQYGEIEPTQYVDLADWLNDLLQERNDYWSNVTLEESHSFSELKSEEYLSVTHTLPAPIYAKLRQMSVEQTEALLLNCWQRVLSVHFEKLSTCFVQSSGRSWEELKDIVGNLEKSLPFTAAYFELNGAEAGTATAEKLKQQRELEHDITTQLEKDVNNYPSFRFVNGQNESGFTIVGQQIIGDLHPLSLSVFNLHSNIEVQVNSVLNKEKCDQLVDEWIELIGAALEAKNTPMNQLSILPTAEKDQLLQFGRGNETPQSDARTLYDLFSAQVKRSPEATAIVSEKAHISYQELTRRAGSIAAYLSATQEETVGLFTSRSVDMISAMLGVCQAGKTYVPIEQNYPAERINSIVESSGIKCVLSDGRMEFPAQVNEVKVISTIEASNGDFASTDSAMAYILYTSGSTGTPKGVMVGNHQLVNHMLWMQKAYPLDQSDRVLLRTPYGFDASVWEIFSPLVQGAQLVLLPSEAQQNVHDINEFIQTQEITVFQAVPTLLNQLLKEADQNTFKSVRQIFCGGEPLPLSLVNEVLDKFRVDLINLYGPTECTIQVAHHKCEKGATRIPVGQPIDGVQLYVLDEERQLSPIGVPGELYISGNCVAQGYKNQPNLTAEVFIPNHMSSNKTTVMYKTGDHAFWDENGMLHISGRLDNQIKLRGFRIELEEIEQVMRNHAGISDAVAVVTGEGELQSITCFYTTLGSAIGRDQLKSFAKTKLAEYMIPSQFIELEKIPQASNGKANRRALQNLDCSLIKQERVTSVPSNKTEQQILDIWKELLKQEDLCINDNFFDVGGHSLLAVNLATRIQLAFECKFPLSAVFDQPTIAEQSIFLTQDANQSFSCLVRMNKTESDLTPLYLCPPTGGMIGGYTKLVQMAGDRPVFALQDPWFAEAKTSYDSVEELASIYAGKIKVSHTADSIILGGWSFGGVVALETARILASEGIEVEHLLVFDTYAPQELRTAPPDEKLNLSVARLLADMNGKRITSEDKMLILGGNESAINEHLLQLAIDAKLLPDEGTIDQFTELISVFKSNVHSMSKYICTAHPFEVHLFEPKEPVPEHLKDAAFDRGELKAVETWQKFGTVISHEVSGHHLNMLESPHVEKLSIELYKLLKPTIKI